jgi:putative ABC transport system permease protein
MSTTDIGWTGMATSLVLIVIAVALSWFNHLGLERSMLWAALRAAAQLLVVGSALTLVFDATASIWWAWAWVAGMIVVAAATVRWRAREVPGAFSLALVALIAVAVVSLGTIFWLGIFPLEAQAIIPLAGMNIGNAMAACVVVSRRIVAGMADNRDEIEAALLPQIESTKAVGLIALPGAMTGLILAGVAPAQAVRIQVAVMYLILGSVATSVTVVGIGLTRRLFTSDHRMVVLARRLD